MPPVTLPGTPNVGTMLGQLAMPGAQAGPIPVTPYAPTNVQPLWMPAETPGKAPKITQPQQNPFQFGGGGGYGGVDTSGPITGTAGGGGKGEDKTVSAQQAFSELAPAQQQARIAAGTAPPPSYGANVLAKFLQSQGVNPGSVMPNYEARVAQSQPAQTQPTAAAAKPTAVAKPAVQGQATVHPQAAQSLSQTLAQMGVPYQQHPAVIQSLLNPSLLGGGAPRSR